MERTFFMSANKPATSGGVNGFFCGLGGALKGGRRAFASCPGGTPKMSRLARPPRTTAPFLLPGGEASGERPPLAYIRNEGYVPEGAREDAARLPGAPSGAHAVRPGVPVVLAALHHRLISAVPPGQHHRLISAAHPGQHHRQFFAVPPGQGTFLHSIESPPAPWFVPGGAGTFRLVGAAFAVSMSRS